MQTRTRHRHEMWRRLYPQFSPPGPHRFVLPNISR
jgi:hypothetical protein